MLYGNMEQLAKLSVSTFAVLPWIDYSRDFIIKNIKKCLKICRVSLNVYFKIHLKEMHH